MEEEWTGAHGNEYTDRNSGESSLPSLNYLFSEIISGTVGVENILEVGAGNGLNLQALNELDDELKLSAVEVNKKAFELLDERKYVDASNVSFYDFDPGKKWDFVFTKGFMIHVRPERICETYMRLDSLSDRYVCFVEYYNPTALVTHYRGTEFVKRDFAGEFMSHHPDKYKLVKYGFVYKNDPLYPLGDVTWFLMEKK